MKLYWPQIGIDSFKKILPRPLREIILPPPEGRRALIVVDLQESFPAACDPNVKENCSTLAQEFRKNNEHIFMLEYVFNGESSFEVSQHLLNYDKVFWTRKNRNDGSPEIINLLGLLAVNGVHINEFVVCGVNTSCCVADTVWGLMKARCDAKITVVASAVNDGQPANAGWHPLDRIRALQTDTNHLNILE